MPLRRLSSLASSMSCVWLALVCAEKPTLTGWYLSGMPLMSLSSTERVLPVPVGPTQSTWKSWSERRSSTDM